jgi:hypothetical protein
MQEKLSALTAARRAHDPPRPTEPLIADPTPNLTSLAKSRKLEQELKQRIEALEADLCRAKHAAAGLKARNSALAECVRREQGGRREAAQVAAALREEVAVERARAVEAEERARGLQRAAGEVGCCLYHVN